MKKKSYTTPVVEFDLIDDTIVTFTLSVPDNNALENTGDDYVAGKDWEF